MIRYYSTNRQAPPVSLGEALLTGQAPDRGLYMPETIPAFSRTDLASLSGKTYPEIAEAVLSRFLEDCLPPETLRRLCRDAYTYPVPLEHVTDRSYILRLDRGPTASFKDFAARMMAGIFGEFNPQTGRDRVILTATSGDTGSAVANAFFGIPGIRVMVLFPEKEVSDTQRRQMTTLGGNVTIVCVDGQFDDCQALVKQAFADPELGGIPLSSANSINIGRLLPQAVYYVYAYAHLAEKMEPVTFCVPSGNFGNMMGALLAGRMGVPIRRLAVATNANDEVPVYFRTEEYHKIVPSRVCISNAMNVGHPSNFARVIDLYGGWMDETGRIRKTPDLAAMRRDLWPATVSDDETRRTIQSAWHEHGLLLEPHGAVAWAALNRYIAETGESGLRISVETAHPAKFPEEIGMLLGFAPEIPPALSGLDGREEWMISMADDYGTFRNLLRERYGA